MGFFSCMWTEESEDMDASSLIPLDDVMPTDFSAIDVVQSLIEQHNAIFTDANETVWRWIKCHRLESDTCILDATENPACSTQWLITHQDGILNLTSLSHCSIANIMVLAKSETVGRGSVNFSD